MTLYDKMMWGKRRTNTMRMKKPFEAYIDDYNYLSVYMSKNFFNGDSRIFHMKDTKEKIYPLSLISRSDLYNGYTHYKLSWQGDIEIGDVYTLYDEHCKTVVCQYGHIVKTDRFNEECAYTGNDLGCTYLPETIRFKLWAPSANRIQLCLKGDLNRRIIEMKREDKGIFEIEIDKKYSGYRYNFMVYVNGQWNETIDPYSFYCTENGSYSVIVDPKSVHFSKKVLLPELKSPCDAILYEASVRDMTSQAGIGVLNPKTFVGFTQENETTKMMNTGFSYIKSLGVTHIQLLPVFDFGSVDEMHPDIFYNWGYDPTNHRCLEGSYSTDPTNPIRRVEEFSKLVHDCHKAGLKVNLDLVFNHVYEKEFYPLEQLVPNYYFLMNTEGEFSNGSFCGNDVDTKQPMARKYFLNTCLHIIRMYDVDGFRFDLMGVLDLEFMNEICEECKKLKPDFMIYGEGWNMPSFLPEYDRASIQNQGRMKHIGHFNDFFREHVRGPNGELERKGYSSGAVEYIDAMQHCLSGCVDIGKFDDFEKSINYVECHDNHTLWDKNRACCLEENSEIREKRQIIANAFVLLSQGVPFIHAGQEFGRTKQNIGDSYNRSDNYNHIDYQRRDHHITIYNETKALIKIRKEHRCFRLKDTSDLANVHFDTIENQALVYFSQKESDACAVIFNPVNRYFNYTFDCEGTILFDNGHCNNARAQNVFVAPYSVVVIQF